ncbi:hypothetical protein QVD17_06454 [Tagetes erecta]|uniref:Uncharacterized protein n=1 Tax=Tagetes erecta TaxID=13708 RepID=A0AAD8P6H1_TARER|nr:hypothetical protein QVD17_06454 [Tagetes erecta]
MEEGGWALTNANPYLALAPSASLALTSSLRRSLHVTLLVLGGRLLVVLASRHFARLERKAVGCLACQLVNVRMDECCTYLQITSESNLVCKSSSSSSLAASNQ